jgi:hypothetical protein
MRKIKRSWRRKKTSNGKSSKKAVNELLAHNNEAISKVTETNDLFVKLVENLSISISTNKFAVAAEAFIGVSRDFTSEIKDNLINWVFTDFQKSGDKNLRHTKELFKSKVLDRLNYFIFEDEKFSQDAAERAGKELEAFYEGFRSTILVELEAAYGEDEERLAEATFTIFETAKALKPADRLPVPIKEKLKLDLLRTAGGLDDLSDRLLLTMIETYNNLMSRSPDIDFLRFTTGDK